MEVYSLETVWVCFIMFLAGAVHGTVGFGSGLVGVALIGCIVIVRDASILMTIPVGVLSIVLFWRLRTHFCGYMAIRPYGARNTQL